jgi:glycerol-3-phosphate acyltransferase PlsY
MDTIFLLPLLFTAAGFLVGSVPFGLLLVRLAGKGDVRSVGSGNIGATNVVRAGGKWLGVLTLVLDVLKGFLPVFFARHLGLEDTHLALVALAAVLGHVFTPWLRFKGGKGVATALGVALAFNYWMVLPSLGIFILVVAMTRFVSLGSILAALAMPIFLYVVLGSTPSVFVIWLLVSLLVVVKHWANILRLIKGTENQLVRKRGGGVADE